MASFLTGLATTAGTVAKGIGTAASGIGKGFLQGAAGEAGLGQIFKPATYAMRSPTGTFSRVAEVSKPSIWNEVGSALGKQAVGGGVSSPSSPSLPTPSTETSVFQSRGYQSPQMQGPKRKAKTVEDLLRELARR